MLKRNGRGQTSNIKDVEVTLSWVKPVFELPDGTVSSRESVIYSGIIARNTHVS